MNHKAEQYKQLLEGVKRMDADALDEFVNEVLLIKAQRSSPNLSEEESALMEKINQGLLEGEQQRLQELVNRRQQGLMTEAEQQELIQLTDKSEEMDAERMRWLGQLAVMRNLPLRDLMQQLQLSPL